MTGLGVEALAACQMANMTCACMTNDAAAYWAQEWPYVFDVMNSWLNFSYYVTFAAGVLLGIILLLLADWVYKRWFK